MAEQFTADDLEDFMEILMTYKCKFCQFTSNATQDMAEHVRSTHQKHRRLQDKTKEIPNEPATSIQESLIQQSMTNLSDPITNRSEGASFDKNVNTSVETDTAIKQHIDTVDVANNDPKVNSSEPLLLTMPSDPQVTQVYNDNGNILSDAVDMSNIQFINQDADGSFIIQNGQNVQFDNGSTVQVLVQNSQFESCRDQGTDMEEDMVEQVNDKSKVLLEGAAEIDNNLHYIIESEDVFGKLGEKTEAVVNDKTVQEKDSEEAEFTEMIETERSDQKEVELFLCGNCRQGFASIQDCKVHMTQKHGHFEESNQLKVDAATQMEPKKKVGRKRKSEISAIKEQVVEEIALSDSDEDWSEKFEMYCNSLRSQRRRQPPKTLQKDFYLGRSKKKTVKKREDPGLNIRCTIKGCSGKFKQEETLQKHLECHITFAKPTEHQFKCLVCEEKFYIWKLARHHMWKLHKIDMDLLTCEICHTFKTDTMSKMKIHKEVHGAERPYTCSICQKGFKQAAQMKNHLALHDEFKLDSNRTGDGDRWHTPKTCDICERTFANAKCLKKHKEILHTQNKPFKCRYCDHECSRKAMWILHERIHTGEKPYKCDLCHYSCGDHNSLRRHKMRHTGHKPYKCPHCPYACIQAISLKVHIKNKHPGMGGIYNCSMCLYRTVNLQQYENHQKDHKNGLIEKTVENADGLDGVKLNVKQRKSKNLLEKQEITTITLPQSMISNFQTQTVSMQNMALPQIVQIPASALSGIEHSEPFEMQIEMKEDGSHVIAGENGNHVSGEEVTELSKITDYDGIVQSDMAAAQLIYSALSAITQNSQGDNSQVVAGVENGDIQTSIETDSSQGVTTHTITFHLPEGEELSGQGTVIEQVQKDSEGLTVIQVEGGGVQQWSSNSVIDLENV